MDMLPQASMPSLSAALAQSHMRKRDMLALVVYKLPHQNRLASPLHVQCLCWQLVERLLYGHMQLLLVLVVVSCDKGGNCMKNCHVQHVGAR